VLWHSDKAWLLQAQQQVASWLQQQRRLLVKPTWQLNRSERGLSFCGYRIYPGSLRLTRRKRRRYRDQRLRWEQAYAAGRFSANDLQRRMQAIIAVTAHAQARSWRQRELHRHPMPACCAEL